MKKYLLLLTAASFSFAVHTAKAQSVMPVAGEDGFEVWHADILNGSAYDPNNSNSTPAQWQCLNVLSSSFLGGSPVSVFWDSVPSQIHQGKYSCKIISIKLSNTSFSYVSAFLRDTTGIVMAGSLTPTPSFKPGVPFNQRISQYTFWYLYSPNIAGGKPDTASCQVVLTHFSGGASHIIGQGEYLMNAASSWTQGTVNITYDSAVGNPDTIEVIFNAASFYRPLLNDTLIIDQSSVVLGINEIHAKAVNVNVYPNPAYAEVHFTISGNAAHNIAIYNITGQKVYISAIKNNKANVNTSTYGAGIYIYQVLDTKGSVLSMGKFSVVK